MKASMHPFPTTLRHFATEMPNGQQLEVVLVADEDGKQFLLQILDGRWKGLGVSEPSAAYEQAKASVIAAGKVVIEFVA